MMILLSLLALTAQVSSATQPVEAWISTGWACHTRPMHTDDARLAASGCARTSLAGLDPQGRELWFLATVTIDGSANLHRAPLAVAIGAVAASAVFWNDTLVGRNGVPGSSREQEQPGTLDTMLYLPAERIVRGQNALLVHMSGFHNRLQLRTPVHYIVVGEYDALYGAMMPRYLPAMMIAGALLVALAHFGGAWLFGTRDTPALLVVAMAACALGQLVVELWRVMWRLPYHWHAWRLLAIELLATGFVLALVAYVAGRFAPHWRTRAIWCTLLIAVVTAWVPGYDLWTLLTLALPIILALALVFPAARRRVDGAVGIAAAFVFFLGLIAVDTAGFLDRGFYLGTAALAIVLLRDQWRVGLAAQLREIETRRRVDQLEAQLLRRRFAPHWLLNTLNAITEWIESDPPTAVRLIEALGEEYHLVAEMSGKPLVALGEEITLCKKHLEVMSLRVDRAFHLECQNVDAQLPVPPGIIQTLVENAFSHGRYGTGAAFVLHQTVHAGTTQLELTTPTTEDGAPITTRRHRGEGLEYVQAQLRQAFGEVASLVDGPTEAGGWRTQLHLGAVA